MLQHYTTSGIVVTVGVEPTSSFEPVYQTGDYTVHPRHCIEFLCLSLTESYKILKVSPIVVSVRLELTTPSLSEKCSNQLS